MIIIKSDVELELCSVLERDRRVLFLSFGCVHADGGGSDVLEQNRREFDEGGYVGARAESQLGCDVLCLVLVLTYDQYFLENASTCPENALNIYELYLYSNLDVIDLLHIVEFDVIEELLRLPCDFRPVQLILPVAFVLSPQGNARTIIDLIPHKQVILRQHFFRQPNSRKHAQTELVLRVDSPIVPGGAWRSVSRKIEFESVVSVHPLAETMSAESDTQVIERFTGIERCVEVPASSPMLCDTVIEVHLDLIAGFHPRKNGPSVLQSKPHLGLIINGQSLLMLLRRDLQIRAALLSLGIDLYTCQFIMHEIVANDGVWLFGEVSPRLNLY